MNNTDLLIGKLKVSLAEITSSALAPLSTKFECYFFKGPCEVLRYLIKDCYFDYSSEDEDTTQLSLPGWKPLPLNTSWPKVLVQCPKPWRYQTAEELDNYSIRGSRSSYEGGGYVAVLGYDQRTAQGVLGETLGHGWIDRQTRAVILEFAVFNVNTNLLSIGTYFYEVLAAGAAYANRRVETFELYNTESKCSRDLSHLPIPLHGHGALLLNHDVGPLLQTTSWLLYVSLEYGGTC